MQPLIDDLAKIKELEHLDKETLRFLYESIIKYKQYVREQTIDEFTDQLKRASIEGTLNYGLDENKSWNKERGTCKAIEIKKVDEIAKAYKDGYRNSYINTII